MYSSASENGLQAIAFAIQELKNKPDTKPTEFKNLSGTKKHAATNPIIPRLITSYFDFFSTFKETLKKYKNNNPWNQKEVLDITDTLMKMAFAISCLTLDDLKPFTEKLSKKGETRTFIKALITQDSYQYRTFYFCTGIYHFARGCFEWGPSRGKENEEDLIFSLDGISEEHSNQFYKEGTTQYKWMSLYNEYCDRVKQYVDEKELEEAEPRHFNWTLKDSGVESFSVIPNSIPT